MFHGVIPCALVLPGGILPWFLPPVMRYASMRLTTKAIQALKPSERRQEIKDDGGRGLYLFV